MEVEDVIVEETEIEYVATPTYSGTTPTKASTNENNYTFLNWNEEKDEISKNNDKLGIMLIDFINKRIIYIFN